MCFIRIDDKIIVTLFSIGVKSLFGAGVVDFLKSNIRTESFKLQFHGVQNLLRQVCQIEGFDVELRVALLKNCHFQDLIHQKG